MLDIRPCGIGAAKQEGNNSTVKQAPIGNQLIIEITPANRSATHLYELGNYIGFY